MKKYKFKNFKGYFYVERYGGTRKIFYDDFGFYDENEHFLGHIYITDIEAYRELITDLQNSKNEIEFFEFFNQRYDYNIEPQLIMETYCDDAEISPDERELIELDIDQYKANHLTTSEFCDIYDINKVGKYYFRGEW